MNPRHLSHFVWRSVEGSDPRRVPEKEESLRLPYEERHVAVNTGLERPFRLWCHLLWLKLSTVCILSTCYVSSAAVHAWNVTQYSLTSSSCPMKLPVTTTARLIGRYSHPPGGIVITRVCLFVCLLVGSVGSLITLLLTCRKLQAWFHEIWLTMS